MAISLRISKEDEQLFKTYAKMHNISVSDLIREAVLKHIEDECDLQIYQKVLKEYKDNPQTFDLSKLEKD